MLSYLFNRALQIQPLCRSRINAAVVSCDPTTCTTTTSTAMIHPWLLWSRSKHSNTQIKRIFNKHPARARYEERHGIVRKDAELPQHAPQFSPLFEPSMLSNGWSQLPPPDIVAAAEASIPFRVGRTKNKPMDAVGFLPVYAKYRKDGTKAVTRIKKVAGDQSVFLQELIATLQVPASHVRVRTGGTIELTGNRVRDVKLWLAGLGF